MGTAGATPGVTNCMTLAGQFGLHHRLPFGPTEMAAARRASQLSPYLAKARPEFI